MPLRFALLQIRLHPFSKIGTAIDTGQHIIEGNGIFCRTQTPMRLLRRPDRQWSQAANPFRHLEYMRKNALFVDDCREEPTMQCLVCPKQSPCEQHFFGAHSAKRVYQVPVVLKTQAVTERLSYRNAKTSP